MPGSLGAEPPRWLASSQEGSVLPAGTGAPCQLLWWWGEPELLSCSGPLPLESHSPCGSLHEPWGPLSSGGGALVSLAGRQASPPLPSPPGGSLHRSRGCAKLPLGRPQQPIPAAGTRLLQLCKCVAGEQDVSFLFWAVSSVWI